jgi:hypothetical protein
MVYAYGARYGVREGVRLARGLVAPEVPAALDAVPAGTGCLWSSH